LCQRSQQMQVAALTNCNPSLQNFLRVDADAFAAGTSNRACRAKERFHQPEPNVNKKARSTKGRRKNDEAVTN